MTVTTRRGASPSSLETSVTCRTFPVNICFYHIWVKIDELQPWILETAPKNLSHTTGICTKIRHLAQTLSPWPKVLTYFLWVVHHLNSHHQLKRSVGILRNYQSEQGDLVLTFRKNIPSLKTNSKFAPENRPFDHLSKHQLSGGFTQLAVSFREGIWSSGQKKRSCLHMNSLFSNHFFAKKKASNSFFYLPSALLGGSSQDL